MPSPDDESQRRRAATRKFLLGLLLFAFLLVGIALLVAHGTTLKADPAASARCQTAGSAGACEQCCAPLDSQYEVSENECSCGRRE